MDRYSIFMLVFLIICYMPTDRKSVTAINIDIFEPFYGLVETYKNKKQMNAFKDFDLHCRKSPNNWKYC